MLKLHPIKQYRYKIWLTDYPLIIKTLFHELRHIEQNTTKFFIQSTKLTHFKGDLKYTTKSKEIHEIEEDAEKIAWRLYYKYTTRKLIKWTI